MASEKRSLIIKDGVSITDEVVAIISGLAATEVEGVYALSGGLTHEIIDKSGISKLSKGIKLHIDDEKSLSIKLSIEICFGYDMPEVCQQVQEKVKNSIENMTGLAVNTIDINISSIIVNEVKKK